MYSACLQVRNESTDSNDGGSIPLSISPVSESLSNTQAKPSNPPRTSGLHHVGVHVADLETSITLYDAVFGPTERLSLGGAHMILPAAGAQRLELIAERRVQRTNRRRPPPGFRGRQSR